MEEIIKQLLNEQFSEYKKYHIWILSAFILLSIIFNILQSIWFSKKIEKFKTDLKKSEIKFSKYNELQVKALSKLYNLLTKLQKETKIIQSITSTNPDFYNKNVRNWELLFKECKNNFSLEKYILTKELKGIYQDTQIYFDQIWSFTRIEKKYQNSYITDDNGDLDMMIDTEEANNIVVKLENYNRSNLFSNVISKIILLRKSIEKTFEEME